MFIHLFSHVLKRLIVVGNIYELFNQYKFLINDFLMVNANDQI